MTEMNILILNFNYDAQLKNILKSASESLKCKFKVTRIEDNDSSPYFSLERKQYNATKILNNLCEVESFNNQIILTSLDLYIPIFTYVFGLAKLNGNCAIVSTHRLGNRFYGLPVNLELFRGRIVKEIVHEIGHLNGLHHCENYECVMNSSTSVDDLDTKSNNYCEKCIVLSG